MKEDLSERKLKILQAVLGDFINSAEPVGSRTISKKYDMGVSAATIRNEMSDLEDMGYLTHLHTSAGRIPSEKAYRFYVDSLMEKQDPTPENRAAIDQMIRAGSLELDRTLKHASRILSHLTNLASFAMTPDEEQNTLKYVNLLPVDEKTIVLMIVAESGKITNTALRLRNGYDPESLQLMSKLLTHNYKGMTLSSIVTMDIIDDIQKDSAALSGMARDIVPSFISTLESMLNIDLYVNGLENVFSIPEYNKDIEKAKSFIDVLSSREELTRVLMDRGNGVSITIGNENDNQELKDCSVITATYEVNGKCVGKLGVIGPTRMRYSEITSIIEYLTDNLNNAFRLTEGDESDE